MVQVGDARGSDSAARALAGSLGETGVEIVYLGTQGSGRRIAASAAEAGVDAVEVCVAGGGGVAVLRDLLRELTRLGRREISIVVHRLR